MTVEGSSHETIHVYKALGLSEVVNELYVGLVDPSRGPFTKIKAPGGKILKELTIPNNVVEADAIVNLPKTKTRIDTLATLDSKNLKGFLLDDLRRRAHVLGLEKAIAGLAKALHEKAKLTWLPRITRATRGQASLRA
ncbi:MAG: hypothetical protein DRJ97_08115 [Thermoprotei archaeon]|nr:MAG: hypothetical protein DRJ97_08115 [Thermoprotei archaeon]